MILIVRRHGDWRFGLLAGQWRVCIVSLRGDPLHEEDCFLLAGLAWTWCALDRFCNSESNTSLVLAGIVTGVGGLGEMLSASSLSCFRSRFSFQDASRNLVERKPETDSALFSLPADVRYFQLSSVIHPIRR